MVFPNLRHLALTICSMLTLQLSRPYCSATPTMRTTMAVPASLGALRSQIDTPPSRKQCVTLVLSASPLARHLALQHTIRQQRILSSGSVSSLNYLLGRWAGFILTSVMERANPACSYYTRTRASFRSFRILSVSNEIGRMQALIHLQIGTTCDGRMNVCLRGNGCD